jgi:hypothetical protein
MAKYSIQKLAQSLVDLGLDQSAKRLFWHFQQLPNEQVFIAEECGVFGPRIDILRALDKYRFGRFDEEDELFEFFEIGDCRSNSLSAVVSEIKNCVRRKRKLEALEKSQPVKRRKKPVDQEEPPGPEQLPAEPPAPKKSARAKHGQLPASIQRILEAKDLPPYPDRPPEIPAPLEEFGEAFQGYAEFSVNLRCEGYDREALDDCARSLASRYDPTHLDLRWWGRDHESNVDDPIFHAIISQNDRRQPRYPYSDDYRDDIFDSFHNDSETIKYIAEAEALSQTTVKRWLDERYPDEHQFKAAKAYNKGIERMRKKGRRRYSGKQR